MTLIRCSASAPDLWTVRCQLEQGHEGRCRSNMVRWLNPQRVYVGGEPVDLSRESEAWVGGQVLLSHEREPDLGLPT